MLNERLKTFSTVLFLESFTVKQETLLLSVFLFKEVILPCVVGTKPRGADRGGVRSEERGGRRRIHQSLSSDSQCQTKKKKLQIHLLFQTCGCVPQAFYYYYYYCRCFLFCSCTFSVCVSIPLFF